MAKFPAELSPCQLLNFPFLAKWVRARLQASDYSPSNTTTVRRADFLEMFRTSWYSAES